MNGTVTSIKSPVPLWTETLLQHHRNQSQEHVDWLEYRLNFLYNRPVCQWVRLLRERNERDLARIDDPDFPFYYDHEAADHAVDFFDNLTHSKGAWARQPFILDPWQEYDVVRPLFGWLKKENNFRRFKLLWIEVAKKNGKALTLDTLIPTPDGFKTMGEIRPGDSVFDENGKVCKVLAQSEVFKNRPCYEITTATGGKVICDENHEWVLKKGGSTGKDVVIETGKLYREYQRGRRYSFALPGAIETPNVKLPIPAYTLGYWLGDGHSDGARITVGYKDIEVIDYIRAEGVPVQEKQSSNLNSASYGLSDGIRNRFKKGFVVKRELVRLNLIKNKHVPELYFWAGIEDRLNLLRGLMDSDGTCSKAGQCEFTGISERLATDVRRLLRTLGIKSTLIEADAKLNGVFICKKYRVTFNPDSSIPVFKIKRKLERQKKSIRDADKVKKGTGWYHPKARCRNEYIQSIVRVENRDTKCIEVSSESHQFLCSEFMIPTHNSTFGAGLGLYMLTADNEAGAEVYSAATKFDQALLIHHEATRMARRSPRLAGQVTIVKNNISVPLTGSKYEPVSGDSDGLDGINPSGVLADEIHRWKDRDAWDVLEQSSATRDEPLMCAFTTAGTGRTSFCYQQREYMLKVLERIHDDDEVYPFICTLDGFDQADPELRDDIYDPAVWVKANPSLGGAIKPEELSKQVQKAKTSLAQRNTILRYRMNVWAEQTIRWLPMDKWDACQGTWKTEKGKPVIDDMIGKPCYGGLDMSTTIDLTAFVLTFPWENGVSRILPFFFIPEERVEERWRTDKIPYHQWVHDGLIETTPGDAVDYDYVRDRIVELSTIFDIREIGFDPHNAVATAQSLEKEGIPMVVMRQTYAFMNAPSKLFEIMVRRRKFDHAGNKVLRWNASNVAIKPNEDMIRPSKDASSEKIDGIVAAIMAEGRASFGGNSKSVYEERGLLSLQEA